MKIINHNKNNYTYDNSGSVIRGTIEVTKDEWNIIKEYLRNSPSKSFDYMDIALERAEISYYDIFYSLGVTPTEMIFKHFNLPRYKRQNYQFKVITK